MKAPRYLPAEKPGLYRWRVQNSNIVGNDLGRHNEAKEPDGHRGAPGGGSPALDKPIP